MQKGDTQADPSTRIIRFGAFEVDAQPGELKRRGLRVKLQEQPFQVLVALLERPGEIVTREELHKRLWPSDTFVDFDHSLNAAIKRLRDALGESAEAPIFVETMARRRYRFVGPVGGRLGEGRSKSSLAHRPKTSLHRFSAVGASLALTIVLLSCAAWRYSGRSAKIMESKLTTHSEEISEWEKKTQETLFANDRLDLALHWLPDDRLIYALSSLQPMQDSSLWVTPLGKDSGASAVAKQIAGGNGWIPRMSGRADGKTVVFARGNRSPSVYIGTLSADGTQLVSHQRLTLDATMSLPFSWTPDSKAVFFNSIRSGIPVIFKQTVDEPFADILVRSKDQVSQPRLAPDGTEIVYVSTPESGGAAAQSSIFAVSINGGVPRLILKDTEIYAVECARAPSATCVYSVSKGDHLETYRFDLKRGKLADPPQIDPYCSWSLSPDGSQRAIVVYGANVRTIQLRSMTTGKSRELVLKGWEGLMNIDWSTDGKSLFVVWHDFQRDSALLNVSLEGQVSVLVRSNNPEVFWAIPSPDGRSLAIAEAQNTLNIWQIENF
jgi:DNA-binding winged helix-turn-helix (wHTH) protein/Tol biopolymer transport system component